MDIISPGKILISQIQEVRNSKVITYVTGDRPIIGSRIAEDAVRPLYEHLLSVGRNKKIDLFLYSRGGDVSVPWRIVTMFREFCDEFSILVPYKAHSAATLISLGADAIFMGKKAELSPIDPTLVKMTAAGTSGDQKEISVEDVNSYLSFLKDRANINDQSALAQGISILANDLTPLTLGSVNRQNSHIRLVARKLLTSRKRKIDEAKINSIIETLTEKIYSHGHAIGRKEASAIGLPVQTPDGKLEEYIWNLYTRYEDFLKLTEPFDLMVMMSGKEEEHLKDVPMAVIESESRIHMFASGFDLKRKRQIPPNPQINVNLALNLPPGISPQQIPAEVQPILQQMLNSVATEVQKLVQQEIRKQSPEIGVDLRTYGGRWQEVTEKTTQSTEEGKEEVKS